MNIEEIRDYCLQKMSVTESFPFDADTLVFKVANKMFLLASLEKVPLSVNLKCNPERANSLRENHEAILPGFHMSKKHWNTVLIDGSLSDDFIIELIDHSYSLVVASLPKKIRDNLT